MQVRVVLGVSGGCGFVNLDPCRTQIQCAMGKSLLQCLHLEFILSTYSITWCGSCSLTLYFLSRLLHKWFITLSVVGPRSRHTLQTVVWFTLVFLYLNHIRATEVVSLSYLLPGSGWLVILLWISGLKWSVTILPHVFFIYGSVHGACRKVYLNVNTAA